MKQGSIINNFAPAARIKLLMSQVHEWGDAESLPSPRSLHLNCCLVASPLIDDVNKRARQGEGGGLVEHESVNILL